MRALSFETRLSDWRSRLSRYIESVRADPFVWGESDCACFAAGAVEAMTGADPMADFRGAYSSPSDGRRLLRSLGAAPRAKARTHKSPVGAQGDIECRPSPTGGLGTVLARSFEEVHPAFARDGDLALIETDGPFGAAIGVFMGERIMSRAVTGVDSAPRREAARAFRI